MATLEEIMDFLSHLTVEDCKKGRKRSPYSCTVVNTLREKFTDELLGIGMTGPEQYCLLSGGKWGSTNLPPAANKIALDFDKGLLPQLDLHAEERQSD